MEFRKLCPKCMKSYTNGAVGDCGECKVELRKIESVDTYIKPPNYIHFVYKFKGEKE